MARCKGCEAEVIWASTVNGASFALDPPPPVVLGKQAAPAPGLKLYVLVVGIARRPTDEDRRLHRQMYTCHFDTCEAR